MSPANALGLFSPVITLVLYAISAQYKGQMLATDTAFTSIALLAMVTHPANTVMTIVPRAIVEMANVDCIQSYLIPIVYLIQNIYLQTSRELRLIELESKAAVYSNFLETIEGVTTIRAFRWEHKLAAVILPDSQTPW
jgi:ABC-type multidrug transport system fused ATPase/permease subunit